MRQTISGLFAAFAVLFAGAAPAMACGYSTCGSPCGYVSPCAQTYYAPTFSYGFGTGCGNCGTGWGTGYGYQQLAEPETQYYYVNQGPTYTGPGAFAPYPTYQENAIVAPGDFGVRRYGYGPRYGYLPRAHYGYYSPRYGYVHRYAPYHYGRRVLRTYY